MNAHCPQCCALLPDQAQFCSICGTDVTTADRPPRRGTVLRDTQRGDGIVVVDGQQFAFPLEGAWRSATAPAANQAVHVWLDEQGKVVRIMPIPDAVLLQNQLEGAVKVASMLAARAGAASAPLMGRAHAVLGIPVILALFGTIVGWYALTTLSINVSPTYQTHLTFYEILKAAHAGGSPESWNPEGLSGAGGYGFFAVVALLLPLAPVLSNDRRAWFGCSVPAAYMAVASIAIYWQIRSAMRGAEQMARGFGGQTGDEMVSQVLKMALDALSFGFGFYVSIACALYLAVESFRRARANA